MKNGHRTDRRSKLSLKMNIVFALLIALLVLGVFLLNAIALLLSNRYPLSIDLTANAAYEIGEETRALLDGLQQDVQIDVLASENSFGGDAYLVQAKRILDRYAQASPRVHISYIDYASDPSYASQHADLTLNEGDILVSSGEKRKQLALSSLFNYAYTASGSISVESSRAEEAVTAAILNLISGKDVLVGVLTGHGEQEAKHFTALLVNNNYALESAVPATDDLARFDALLLLAPQIDFSEDDVRKLEAFLYNGGAYGKTLFYTASVSQATLPKLETLLGEWGVYIDGGAVFETESERTYQYQPFYPVADYAEEAYRDMLIDASAPMLMPLARPMRTLFSMRDGQYVEELLAFAESAGVRPADAGEDFAPKEAETWGPFPAMALLSRQVMEDGAVARRSNIVASASTAMLDELCLQNASLANSDYLLNLINDLCERGETVNIAPKSLSGKTLGVNTRQVTTLGALLGGVLPLTILLIGVGVFLYRRYK